VNGCAGIESDDDSLYEPRSDVAASPSKRVVKVTGNAKAIHFGPSSNAVDSSNSPLRPFALVARSSGSMAVGAGYETERSNYMQTVNSDFRHMLKTSPDSSTVRSLGQSTPRSDPKACVAVKRQSPVLNNTFSMSLFPSTQPSSNSSNEVSLEPRDPIGDFLSSIGHGQRRSIFEKFGYTGSRGLRALCEHAKTMTCEMRKILVEEGKLTVNESLSILSKLIEKGNN
jgi:hypothetical protein